jgi:WD40 repeat protein
VERASEEIKNGAHRCVLQSTGRAVGLVYQAEPRSDHYRARRTHFEFCPYEIADGQRAVSASDDGTLKVWELESGRELHTLAGHADGDFAVAVTADGRRAVSVSEDHTLKMWDIESGASIVRAIEFNYSMPKEGQLLGAVSTERCLERVQLTRRRLRSGAPTIRGR